MNSYKKIILFLIVLLIAISMPAEKERVIRSGNRGGPTTLDPAEAWDNTSSVYLANIFNRLVELEPGTLKIKPSLALAWDSDKEGKVWTFRLRQGVKFHDGTPFDADAVIFTFERQMEEKYKYGEFVLFKEIFPFLKSVKKTGKYEVQFILKEPFFPFPATLSVDCTSIISPTALKSMKEKFSLKPVGTGPYRIKEWKKGKKIILESFKDYWKDKPGIDKYIAIIEPNMDKLFELFRKQKIDILTSYSISKMVIFKGYDWVGYSYSTSLSTNYIAFNMKNRYLKKIGVRKALNYLWNKDILKLVYQDHVKPLCSLFPKGMSGYDCDLEKYPMSVEKARKLLNDEGLQKGFELNFLLSRDTDLHLPIVNIFSRNLKKAGIRLKVENVDMDEYFSRISKGDYDLTFSSWLADYPDPFSIISPLFSKKIQSEGLANFSTGENIDILKMIEKARTIKDPVEREQHYKKLNNLVVERALLIPLSQDINLILYNKKLGKIKLNSLGVIDLFLMGKQ